MPENLPGSDAACLSRPINILYGGVANGISLLLLSSEDGQQSYIVGYTGFGDFLLIIPNHLDIIESWEY